VIEINALRVPGRDVQPGQNQTETVTAKARILKGTAVPGTTIDCFLTIEAIDGTDVIHSSTTDTIRLGIGKGGKGAKVVVGVPRCNSGIIKFVATFSGFDANNRHCTQSRSIRKACR